MGILLSICGVIEYFNLYNISCFIEGARPLAGGGAEEAAGGGQQEPAGRPPPAGRGDQEAQEGRPRQGKCSKFLPV